MKEARDSVIARIKQLKRQKKEWFAENARDQRDYLNLLEAEEEKEAEILAANNELGAIKNQIKAKAQEMVGENKVQIDKFDQLIASAEQELASL